MAKTAKPTSKARYLFLLRHAKAVPSGKDDGDFGRPLNEKGEKDAQKMATLFRHQGLLPERALCSPALRTRQTFKALSESLPDLKASFPKSLYLIEPERLLKLLQKTPSSPASILVVGHNPGIESLAASLIDPKLGGDLAGLERMKTKFPTGALAVLHLTGDWKNLSLASCRLEAFVRPKDIA
jgi:phosphohistidine phosphatase